jgi:hypothetical protein
VRDVLLMASRPRFVDRETLWFLFLSVSGGFGVFTLLHELVFHYLMPSRPTLGMALSIAAGTAFAVVSPLSMHRLRGKLAGLFTSYRPDLEQDASEGVAELYSADNVESWFDLEQDPRCRDLVVRFPEGEVRVDSSTCEHEGISEPLSGWCRIARLPRTGQVLDITTKHA